MQSMPDLLHQLIRFQADTRPDSIALWHGDNGIDYAALADLVTRVATGLRRLGLETGDRVGVYLPKTPACVAGFFGAAAAGGVFVPINPVLKAPQVGHILRDCGVRVLITGYDRALALGDELAHCPELDRLVLTDRDDPPPAIKTPTCGWPALTEAGAAAPVRPRIDTDVAAIFYTSGSTGRPKGVVLSHRNLIAGADSVCSYLENVPDDRLLAVLPFGFDYGFSQLSTAFTAGAGVALMDYLLPRDVVRALARHRITGLAAVPPLWNQLTRLDWPDGIAEHLRYITNSGGTMPLATTRRLQRLLPHTDIYLMYGLTEAFRSTYLPPDQVEDRPDSIGKAIPNAEVLVVRPDGSACEPGESGELVHRGALVALGYWNDPDTSAVRFKPAPGQPEELPHPELAVWSGDQVHRDADGFLYFESRRDEMIKTSGYRVSPDEVEEVVLACDGVAQAVAMGIDHPALGQAIVLAVQPATQTLDLTALETHLKRSLPAYMVPAGIEIRSELPRNANGKLDRSTLTNEYADYFSDD